MAFTHIKKSKGSQYKGVHKSSTSKKFFAKICMKNGSYISKDFKTELQAHKHYLEMRELLNLRRKRVKEDLMESVREVAKQVKQKKKVLKSRKIKRKNPLKDRKRYYNTLTQSDKNHIHGKARHHCELCGIQYTEHIEGEVDHVIPLQYFGTNNYPNLQSICTACHKWKCSHLDKIIGNMQENADYNDKIDKVKEVQQKLFEKKYGVNKNTNIIINNNKNTISLNISS